MGETPTENETTAEMLLPELKQLGDTLEMPVIKDGEFSTIIDRIQMLIDDIRDLRAASESAEEQSEKARIAFPNPEIDLLLACRSLEEAKRYIVRAEYRLSKGT